MELVLFWLLLPLAALSGWWIGRGDQSNHEKQRTQLSSEYIAGLNLLLNEQPDKAVELFIGMLEVDSETVETHLALGSLFRRRGEVDRAIRIHQNLIARPNLTQAQRMQALYELASDYMRAGVLDRAESLFLELVMLGGYVRESLQRLLDIYEREREWSKAIEAAHKYQLVSNQPMSATIAHYYCEQVDTAIKQVQMDKAQRYIKRALAIDSRHVRAHILQGELMRAQGEYKNAIRCFLRVKTRMPEYMNEIVAPLARCYESMGHIDQLRAFVVQCFTEGLGMQLLTALPSQYDELLEQVVEPADIMTQLKARPSVRALYTILTLREKRTHGAMKEDLKRLLDVLQPLVLKETSYTCEHCGYSVSVLYWHCPSCHQWGTMKHYNA